MKARHAVLTAASALTAAPAFAGLAATATYTDTQPTPGEFQYDLTLHNTGTTTIGTFWFAWVPGAGFLSAVPTNPMSPSGWTETLFNSGHSIRWITSSLLTPGASMSGFSFESTETPAQLAGTFAGPGIGTGDPVATAFVYIAAPFDDPGAQFVATAGGGRSAPEPATLGLLGLGLGGLMLRRGRGKR